MSRTIGALGAALLMLAVMVAPVAATAQTFQLGVDGRLAYGAWSRGDATSSEYVTVTIVQGRITSHGPLFTGTTLLFSHGISDDCDSEGDCSFRSSINLEASGAALSIDPALQTASVDAYATGTRCVISVEGKDCHDVTLHVSISWSATGPFVISHGAGSWGEPGSFRSATHGLDFQRQATATGTADGVNLADFDLQGAWMQQVRFGQISVYICPGSC